MYSVYSTDQIHCIRYQRKLKMKLWHVSLYKCTIFREHNMPK